MSLLGFVFWKEPSKVRLNLCAIASPVLRRKSQLSNHLTPVPGGNDPQPAFRCHFRQTGAHFPIPDFRPHIDRELGVDLPAIQISALVNEPEKNLFSIRVEQARHAQTVCFKIRHDVWVGDDDDRIDQLGANRRQRSIGLVRTRQRPGEIPNRYRCHAWRRIVRKVGRNRSKRAIRPRYVRNGSPLLDLLHAPSLRLLGAAASPLRTTGGMP